MAKHIAPNFRINCFFCGRFNKLQLLRRDDNRAYVPAVPRGWQVSHVLNRILFRCSSCSKKMADRVKVITK